MPEPIRVNYNGLDFSLISPPSPPEAVLRVRPHHSDHVLGTAANLKAWKRMDRLIAALPRWRPRMYDC